MRTTVSLHGLQVYGYHGIFDEERSLGQRFLFSIRCELAPVATHQDDQLGHSVGYDVLAAEVSAISAARKFRTMEALAEAIARSLLASHAVIVAVDVEVSKSSPPMAHALDAAVVEVRLCREESTSTG